MVLVLPHHIAVEPATIVCVCVFLDSTITQGTTDESSFSQIFVRLKYPLRIKHGNGESLEM